MIRTVVALCALLLVSPAVAQAAPPNDSRTAPQPLTLPASVAGTTRDSTIEADEPASCAPLRGSVFYELTARTADRIVVRLQAAGDLDAVVEVLRRTRSQYAPVDCDLGDERGRAELTFRPEQGAIYAIRVGQRANSVAGDFRLEVFAPEPPPRPPGRRLARRGATGSLDAVQDTSDAWSARLRSGTTYRVNLSSPTCLSLSLHAPGTRDFDADAPVRRLGCGGYAVFTPGAGEGGRYSLLVEARPRVRGQQRYRLHVARAGRDDTAPGVPLANHRPRRGALRATRIDVVDLYRFAVVRRSDLRLSLRRGPFTLQLLNDAGRRLARTDAGELSLRVAPGRYFVAVRAGRGQRGRYTLVRSTRTITRTSITINGRTSAFMAPGGTALIRVAVAPGAAGPAEVAIERLDPLAGWQFHRQVGLTVTAGTATYAFRPPFEGRWRATARFLGSRIAAPSEAGRAHVLVAPPLRE